jgi:hypothetical protein
VRTSDRPPIGITDSLGATTVSPEPEPFDEIKTIDWSVPGGVNSCRGARWRS